MAEQPSLRDRATAVGAEIHELRRQAALADDVQTLVPLKTCDRELKLAFGTPALNEPGDAYGDLKARLLEQAYQEDLATEQVVQRRIETLTAKVRREVEAEHAAEFQARADELSELEADVTERERQATPSYRARFAAAGAGLALVADVLIRVAA